MGFPGGLPWRLSSKEFACNTGAAGSTGSISGLGRSPGGGPDNPLQSSCLENLHGQSSLMGYSPCSHKESDMPEATQHACTQSGPCSGICLPLKLMTADCLGLHLSSPERRRAPESQMPEPQRVSVMDSYTQGLGLGLNHSSVQFTSVTQSCPTLCDPMNCSTPGFPIHHQLPEFTQTHMHGVGDATQPSHPLSSPSPPAPNPSQHQSLFQ